MSQNKFMHPRNIYKKAPSFKEMAINYPEFRRFAKPDISGKITIDFKDPAALRALTCTLLEKDFGLKIEIPLSRLIPTLPLRLNYLLWIEDLLDVSGIQRSEYPFVSGLDIGTGASCIYPLLAAKQNNWQMLATEVDDESFEMAQRNIQKNDMHNLVTVKLVEGGKLLTDVLHNDKIYMFSMCNPPFFSCEEDLDFTTKSRSSSRPPPHNGITGDLKELVAPGGEVSFILKMMEESKELDTKIRIYTTMVGHKASLAVLKLELKKLNVTSMTETRFCQGNTTRWGIAWTFDKSLSLQKAYQTPSPKKSSTPMAYAIPRNALGDEKMYTVEIITQRVTNMLVALEVQSTCKKKNKYMAMFDVKAFKNTWSHQRLRKRLQSSKHRNLPNGSALSGTGTLAEQADPDDENLEECAGVKRDMDKQENEISFKRRKREDTTIDMVSSLGNSVSREINVNSCLVSDADNQGCSSDVVQQESASLQEEETNISKGKTCEKIRNIPLLEATLFVRSLAAEIHIELLWRGGTGGRESMHQVLQYFKNRLK